MASSEDWIREDVGSHRAGAWCAQGGPFGRLRGVWRLVLPRGRNHLGCGVSFGGWGGCPIPALCSAPLALLDPIPSGMGLAG